MEQESIKARRFLHTLYGGVGDDALHGWAFIARFEMGTFTKHGGPTSRAWFKWPDDHEVMLRHFIERQHEDLYISPMVYAERGHAKASNALASMFLYADADNCHPSKFAISPTIIVETSPGRFQCYWRVDDTTDPLTISNVSRRIAHNHLEDGCDGSGFSIGHLMRLPQSTNNKPHVGKYEVRAWRTEMTTSTKAVCEVYPDAGADLIPEQEPIPDDLPSLDEAYEIILSNRMMTDLYRHPGMQGHATMSRSQILWKFLCELSRLGLSREYALVLGMNCATNKWKTQPGKGIDSIWRQVCKAYSDPINKPIQSEADATALDKVRAHEDGAVLPEEVPPEALSKKVVTDRGKPIQLLTQDEYLLLKRDTFVDDWEDWARTRTDAAVQYHRAAALTLLAVILADFGRSGAKFDQGPLNLWFLIMGGTTRSRKSTSRRYMLNALDELNDEATDTHYDLGSDVTPEGLTVELSDAPNRSKLFHRDEFHGMLKQIGTKTYLHGLKELLTNLFDGRTDGRVRATGAGNVKAAPTALSLYFMGVTEDICRHMTAADFRSGFLNRFFFVHAPSPPLTAESIHFEQVDPDEWNRAGGVDPVFASLVERLQKLRSFWLDRVGGVPGKNREVIILEDDALSRFNEFITLVSQRSSDHELSETLEPAVDRLTKAVYKVICIIAMSQGRSVATLYDVIKVISWAEHWFGDLVFVAQSIHSTEWSRKMDEVQGHLDAFMSTQVSWSQLYQKVRHNYTPKEFTEIITALVHSGIITVHNGGRGERTITRNE